MTNASVKIIGRTCGNVSGRIAVPAFEVFSSPFTDSVSSPCADSFIHCILSLSCGLHLVRAGMILNSVDSALAQVQSYKQVKRKQFEMLEVLF